MRKTMSFLAWAGLVLLAVLLLYSAWLAASVRSVRNAHAALVAAGRPTLPEEIIPPPVPDEDNAAVCYEAALLRLHIAWTGGGTLLDAMEALARSDIDAPTNAAARHTFRDLAATPAALDAFAMVADGVARPVCRYDLDYTLGWNLSLTHPGQAERSNPAGTWIADRPWRSPLHRRNLSAPLRPR